MQIEKRGSFQDVYQFDSKAIGALNNIPLEIFEKIFYLSEEYSLSLVSICKSFRQIYLKNRQWVGYPIICKAAALSNQTEIPLIVLKTLAKVNPKKVFRLISKQGEAHKVSLLKGLPELVRTHEKKILKLINSMQHQAEALSNAAIALGEIDISKALQLIGRITDKESEMRAYSLLVKKMTHENPKEAEALINSIEDSQQKLRLQSQFDYEIYGIIMNDPGRRELLNFIKHPTLYSLTSSYSLNQCPIDLNEALNIQDVPKKMHELALIAASKSDAREALIATVILLSLSIEDKFQRSMAIINVAYDLIKTHPESALEVINSMDGKPPVTFCYILTDIALALGEKGASLMQRVLEILSSTQMSAFNKTVYCCNVALKIEKFFPKIYLELVKLMQAEDVKNEFFIKTDYFVAGTVKLIGQLDDMSLPKCLNHIEYELIRVFGYAHFKLLSLEALMTDFLKKIVKNIHPDISLLETAFNLIDPFSKQSQGKVLKSLVEATIDTNFKNANRILHGMVELDFPLLSISGILEIISTKDPKLGLEFSKTAKQEDRAVILASVAMGILK